MASSMRLQATLSARQTPHLSIRSRSVTPIQCNDPIRGQYFQFVPSPFFLIYIESLGSVTLVQTPCCTSFAYLDTLLHLGWQSFGTMRVALH